MAKKVAKKPASKPAAKAAKPAPKPAAKKGGGGGGGWPGKPKPVTTGKGPGLHQIGADLVAMFNRAKFQEIEDKYWSPGIVSVEAAMPGQPGMAFTGRANVEAKNAFWMGMNTIRGASAEGPYVGATGFAVKFRMEVEEKASLKRFVMEEIGVYTVKDGKIVREEFMYGSRNEVSSAAPTEHA